MGNTRNKLRDIGAQTMNEEALVQAGLKTIRDAVAEALASRGITEASFKLELNNGETFSVTSDTNPVLDRPAADLKSVEVKQTAKAGGLDWTVSTVFTVN